MSRSHLMVAFALSLCAAVVSWPANALPPLDQNLVWTNPLQPVAGTPTEVLFEDYAWEGYDYAFAEATTEGNSVVLVFTRTGEPTGTDLVLYQRVFSAVVPPLPAGSYPLIVRHAQDGEASDDAIGTLVVSDSADTPRVLPAEGYWSSPQQPGSGLFLERRDDLLSVALYSYKTYRNLRPGWWLGTASSTTNTWLVPLLEFDGGSCLGCADYAAPRSYAPGDALRLRFESARRALVDVNGSATVPVVSTPYGVEYLDVPLADSVDATWGPLRLPDLRGEWVFAIEEHSAGYVPLRLHLTTLEIVDGAAVFRQGEDYRLACRSADAEHRAGCAYAPGLSFGVPPPGMFPAENAWFALGDIEEDRMRGTAVVGERTLHVRAFRLPAANPARVADHDAAH